MSFCIRYCLTVLSLTTLFCVTGNVSSSKQMRPLLHDVTNTMFSYFTKKHSRTHSTYKPVRKSQCSFKGKVSDRFIGGPGCEPKGSSELLNTRLLGNADELFDAESGAKKSQALGDKHGAVLQW